jgi:hypothetical protein
MCADISLNIGDGRLAFDVLARDRAQVNPDVGPVLGLIGAQLFGCEAAERPLDLGLNAFALALDCPDENSRRRFATSALSTAEASGRSSLNSFQRVAPPSSGCTRMREPEP